MPCIEKIYEKITVGNTSYSVDNDNEPYFCPHELADFTEQLELIYFSRRGCSKKTENGGKMDD